MSAPDTDLETQTRRHPVPIWGIALSAIFGIVIGGLITLAAVSRGDDPEGAATVVDGRTGEVESAAD